MLHLFHPAMVHFSVAFLIVGGAGEACGLFADRERLVRFGGTLVVIGTLSLIPTIVTGYLAANTVVLSDDARPVLDAHERNGVLLLGLFVATLFWKGWTRGRIPRSQRPWYAILLLLGVLLAAYSALLGGELVYSKGIGVL
jgi:uncharacterized membrane protein